MVFSSLVFLCIFLPITFGLYLVMPGIRAKNALLIVASLLFYAYGEPVYVLLMILSTVANYIFGRGIQAQLAQGQKGKGWLIASLIFNLGMLGVFKYADMFVGALDTICGFQVLPYPNIMLPIGISFFTFQAMSYVIDVYRGEVQAQKNYFHVLLYISFFPQLIAGPIVKYHDIEQQIMDRTIDARNVALGLRRFCVGLSKKVLIANTAAVAVDALYAQPVGNLNALAAWLACFAYLVQIYFDFSGYSDMAIGMGRMFGFTFKENFNYPYKSTSIQEFWRRWHISLSTWFKEYLYIPMGGNRKGLARTCINKCTVFLLCGLWHGASWTFVIWGAIHGFFIMLEQFVPIKKLPRPVGHVYALMVVALAFVVFRADTIDQAAGIITAMFTAWTFTQASMVVLMQLLTPLFIVTMLVACVAAFPVKDAVYGLLIKMGISKNAIEIASFIAAFVLLALCFVNLSSGTYNPFIYFRF